MARRRVGRVASLGGVRRGRAVSAQVGPRGGVGAAVEHELDGAAWVGVDLDALAGCDLLDVPELEGGEMSLEELDALEEVALDALGVAAGDEGLLVTVLLVALDAGRGARGAAGML